MQQLPCASISVSPSLNLLVLHAPQQGLRAKQSLATCTPPALLYRSRTRHPPLRLSRCALTAVAQAPLQPGPSPDFFDRVLEREQLLARLGDAPTGILVIIGPCSSGKSALIEDVLGQRGPDKLHLLVDGRSAQLSSPAALCRAFTQQGGFVQRVANWLGDLGISKGPLKMMTVTAFQLFAKYAAGKGLTDKAAELLEDKGLKAVESVLDGSPRKYATMDDVVEILTAAFGAGAAKAAASKSWPVLVIDEVNMLVKWRDGDNGDKKKDLDTLLAFLVKVSKQKKHAHVVLATSDYSFTKWLGQEIGDKFYKVEVVGDFPEAEAREFFLRELSQARLQLQQRQGKAAAQAPVLPDDVWAKVYEVCGGNPGDLLKVAVELRNGPSLDDDDVGAALEGVYAHLMDKVETAAISDKDWKPWQYLTVMQQLLQSSHGAVIASDLRTALGDEGADALLAMVKRGLLGMRASSGWAHDVPAEAFGSKKRVITAASVAHLYCMRRVFGERGEGAAERLQALDSKREGNAGSQEMAGAAVAEDDAISKVQRDIERVEQAIEVVEQAIGQNEQQQASIKAAKEEGWREELQWLREKEKQLREKEKRLGEKEKRLGEEKLLRMRAQTGGA